MPWKRHQHVLVFMMNSQGHISFIKCFIFYCQGVIHLLPVPPWDILSHDFTGYISFMSKLKGGPIHKKIVNFCGFHPFWSIFAAVEQRCLLVHPWISTEFLCIVWCFHEVPGRQELHKNELNALLGLDHPHIAPWSCMSPMKFSHIKVEAMNFGIGSEEIHGKDYEKCAIDCIQDLELASRSLPFWDRTLW